MLEMPFRIPWACPTVTSRSAGCLPLGADRLQGRVLGAGGRESHACRGGAGRRLAAVAAEAVDQEAAAAGADHDVLTAAEPIRR